MHPIMLTDFMAVGWQMVSFIIGLMVGGIIGVFLMCLLQVNKNEREDE